VSAFSSQASSSLALRRCVLSRFFGCSTVVASPPAFTDMSMTHSDKVFTLRFLTRAYFASGVGSATSTDKHTLIASCRLCRSSSMVSPCVAQPGIAGTLAQNSPLRLHFALLPAHVDGVAIPALYSDLSDRYI